MIRSTLGRLRGDLPAPPIHGAADARWSVISSAHDLYAEANDDLVGVALGAAERSRHLRLHDLESRCQEPDLGWVRAWPGEHYRLLPALVQEVGARRVVEIGTFKGQGALALAAAGDVEVVTYDVLAWDTFDDTALRPSDLEGGRVRQLVGDLGDLGDDVYRMSQLDELRAADVVFMTAPRTAPGSSTPSPTSSESSPTAGDWWSSTTSGCSRWSSSGGTCPTRSSTSTAWATGPGPGCSGPPDRTVCELGRSPSTRAPMPWPLGRSAGPSSSGGRPPPPSLRPCSRSPSTRKRDPQSGRRPASRRDSSRCTS